MVVCIGCGPMQDDAYLTLRTQCRSVLQKVYQKKIPFEKAFDEFCSGLCVSEKAWIYELGTGVLRTRGRLECVLLALLNYSQGDLRHYGFGKRKTAFKKNKLPHGMVRDAFFFGLYQLLMQKKIGNQAQRIVLETSEWIRPTCGDRAAVWVRAVLQKYLRWTEVDLLICYEVIFKKEPWRWWGVPRWIWKRIEKRWGKIQVLHFAKASFDRPKLWVRWKKDALSIWVKEEGKKKAKAAFFFERGPVPGAWNLHGNSRVFFQKALKSKAPQTWWVQDLSIQRMIWEWNLLWKRWGGGKRVLDFCAAPGGKAWSLNQLGYEVVATDIQPKRWKWLQENIQKTQAPIEVVPFSNITHLKRFDLVWVDAPCTGSGTLKKHPEIRWIREKKDLDLLKKLQERILEQAWERVSLGGALLYSVCSVLEEEIESWKRCLKNVKLLHEWIFFPQKEPSQGGFAAVLLKKKG